MESVETLDSIDPNVWGPMTWDLLFFIAFHYDNNDKTQYKKLQQLFHLLETMLPCSHCRRHYALNKKEVPPLTTIKKGDPDSAPAWLWILKDMNHQVLGKVCIDYMTLKKKHKGLTCIVSDLNMMDTILFMFLTSKQRTKTCEGINVILELLESIHPFKVCMFKGISETWGKDTFLEKINRLREYYGYTIITYEEMIQHYKQSVAD